MSARRLNTSSHGLTAALLHLTTTLSVTSTLLLGLLSASAQAATSVNIDAIKADPALEKLLPTAYQHAGKTLTTGVNPDVAPVKFIDDDGKIAGFIPDLVSAGAKKLGLKIDFQQTSFDALIPGMKAKRFDFILSLADFPSRQKILTLVDYLNIGETVVAKPTATYNIKSLDDLCGLSASIPRGTATVQMADDLSQKCIAAGKKALSPTTYPDTNTTLLALGNDSANVAWIDSPVASYNATKFPARYKILYSQYIAPYGVGFGADDDGKQLAAAFQGAFLALQKEGVYAALMQKWGLSAADAVPTFPINGAK